jgi:hypothetical protein
MNIIGEILSAFDIDYEDRAKRKAQAKSQRIAQEMQERIQVKEYNGKMYVSVDNIPMLAEECLSINIVDAVSKIRNTITEYKCYTTN